MKKKITLLLIHSAPGRTRLRLLNDKQTLPKLEDFLKVSGVEEVVFKEVTNSLIIRHQPELTVDNLVAKLKKKFPQIEVTKETKIAAYSPDSLAVFFAGLGKKANHGVRRATSDTISIYSLAPTLILVWAFVELIRNPKTPPWYNLINVSKAVQGFLEPIKS